KFRVNLRAKQLSWEYKFDFIVYQSLDKINSY
ncbi:uncharacterized protein METZ01_LOCUS224385, partial [marine metagenome]